MPKSKTHFPQVPLEVAMKVAEAESNGNASDTIERPKNERSNGNALAVPKVDE